MRRWSLHCRPQNVEDRMRIECGSNADRLCVGHRNRTIAGRINAPRCSRCFLRLTNGRSDGKWCAERRARRWKPRTRTQYIERFSPDAWSPAVWWSSPAPSSSCTLQVVAWACVWSWPCSCTSETVSGDTESGCARKRVPFSVVGRNGIRASSEVHIGVVGEIFSGHSVGLEFELSQSNIDGRSESLANRTMAEEKKKMD